MFFDLGNRVENLNHSMAVGPSLTNVQRGQPRLIHLHVGSVPIDRDRCLTFPVAPLRVNHSWCFVNQTINRIVCSRVGVSGFEPETA